MEDAEPSGFGRLVRRLREERNLSQEALSRRAGLSESYVTLIESGRRGRRPGRDTVLALAQALDRPPGELLRAAGRLAPSDENDGAPTFESIVRGDPLLRSDQKQALMMIYKTYVGRSSTRSGSGPAGT